MLFACLGIKQKMMGVAVNADAVDELVRVARVLFSGHVPLSRTGVARALVARARVTRVEKNFMLIDCSNEWIRSRGSWGLKTNG